jgi:hypothetical protein
MSIGLIYEVGGHEKRDLATVLATDHNETSLGYTLNTPEATIFSANNSCILTPEVTQGPYCMPSVYLSPLQPIMS